MDGHGLVRHGRETWVSGSSVDERLEVSSKLDNSKMHVKMIEHA
jgi:hypothetical protein